MYIDLCGMYRLYGLNKLNVAAAAAGNQLQWQRQTTVALISYLPLVGGRGRDCGRGLVVHCVLKLFHMQM